LQELLFESFHRTFPDLEIELQGDLSDAWWRCLQHVSEGRTINVSVDRAVRVKLCVVEGVEGFETEFKRLGLGKLSNFVKSNIEIVNARPIEEAALSVSLSP
jgi:hypothetical protein